MKMKIVAGLAMFFLATTSALAASRDCTSCTVTSIGSGPYYDGLCTSGACVFIKLTGSFVNNGGCWSNASWDYVLDISTASGKSTYALLVASKAASSPVTIYGSNVCFASVEKVTAVVAQ